MDSSGLTDVMLEAGLVGSGTVHGVLSGKNYSRAMICHKIVLESLERLLLKRFLDKQGESMVFENLPDNSNEKLVKYLIYHQRNLYWSIALQMEHCFLAIALNLKWEF